MALHGLCDALMLAAVMSGTLCHIGCQKHETAPASPADPALTDLGEASSGHPPKRCNVLLATVDDINICAQDFQQLINSQSPYVRARYTSNEQKKELLDNLIRFEVLALQAKKEGYDRDPHVVGSAKQLMIKKMMKKRLDAWLTPEDISDEELLAAYKTNHQEFNQPERIRVSAIILTQKDIAKTAANVALGEKGSSNKGFRELVTQYSVDPETLKRGGDLQYFSRNTSSIPNAVVTSAFQLAATGDVAGPIAAQDGRFYIIKRTGHHAPKTISFDQAKRQLRNRLYREKRNKAQFDFVAELKQDATIEIFEDQLQEIPIPPMPPPTSSNHNHNHNHNLPEPEQSPSSIQPPAPQPNRSITP